MARRGSSHRRGMSRQWLQKQLQFPGFPLGPAAAFADATLGLDPSGNVVSPGIKLDRLLGAQTIVAPEPAGTEGLIHGTLWWGLRESSPSDITSLVDFDDADDDGWIWRSMASLAIYASAIFPAFVVYADVSYSPLQAGLVGGTTCGQWWRVEHQLRAGKGQYLDKNQAFLFSVGWLPHPNTVGELRVSWTVDLLTLWEQ